MLVKRKNFLIFGSFGLILLGVILASIIDRVTTSNNGPNDIRARAAITKHLTANATVVSTDAIKGTLTVTDLYFTDESRSGDARNLGTWTVTAPATFNFSTISPGVDVVIAVDAPSFKVSKQTLTATSITPQK
jgi:hypothetical protein